MLPYVVILVCAIVFSGATSIQARETAAGGDAGLTHEQAHDAEIRNESYKRGYQDGRSSGFDDGMKVPRVQEPKPPEMPTRVYPSR